ncbi:MAG: tRNA (adenosine(37)-N6)-threonylcarbamoyltransferase complex dimerization subunit type 1 TsaB [Gammaproteobacteria bacterium]|nr:tRNA (adenosine(37)-N6)-threonylcarbamoyltransferase complex dimerization subunit type 1 TsaB [Gammaproteobacteria bacterium]
MRIVALESSGDACSLALWQDGTLVASWLEIAPRQHTQLLLPQLERLLTAAEWSLNQCDMIAFGAGPGGFTGIRIATAVAQGLAFSCNLPLLPVSTLQALGLQGYRLSGEANQLTAFDARMGELYWGGYCYSPTTVETIIEAAVTPAAVAELPVSGEWFGVGSGWQRDGVLLQQRLAARLRGVNASLHPEAAAVAALAAMRYQQQGDAVLQTPFTALPLYLRNKVVSVA